MKIPFLNLTMQDKLILTDVQHMVRMTAKKSSFILGPDVRAFEEEFASYCGSNFAVGVNSGTDALFLSLLAMGIGPGDEVIVPAFTFIATAFAVSYTGATPVFADIDKDTYNLDPDSFSSAITKRTKGVIPVHLFGQCADMSAIMAIARKRGIKVVEDACQAHGSVYHSSNVRRRTLDVGRKAGAIGDTGCFSFYPTKNLGGWGDGGLITTNDKPTYEKLRILRDCGRDKLRYEHVRVGYNSRLDSLQAVVLREKLKFLDQWNAKRKMFACEYGRLLSSVEEIVTPHEHPGHVYHAYCIRLKKRDRLQSHLHSKGIGTVVYYPLPLHLQKAYKGLKYSAGNFPVSERTCKEILALPMHPFLTMAQIRFVVSQIKQGLRSA